MTEKCKDHSLIASDLSEIKSDIKIIKIALNGNGKLGFCAKVNILWCCSIFVIILVVKEVWAFVVK